MVKKVIDKELKIKENALAKSEKRKAKSEKLSLTSPEGKNHKSAVTNDSALIVSKSSTPKPGKTAQKKVVKKSVKTATKPVEKPAVKPKENLIKSKARVKQHGEVFTPEFIVKQMCDLCEPEISQINKKIFEPTCGNGNFLVEILRRKLEKIKKSKNTKKTAEKLEVSAFEFDILVALSNIYAVDIQEDNILESRQRMHDIVLGKVKNTKSSITFLKAVDEILKSNILRGNTLTMKKTLIFFDFAPNYDTRSFSITKYSMKDLEDIADKTTTSQITNLAQTIADLKYSPKPKRKPVKRRKPSKPQVGNTIQTEFSIKEVSWTKTRKSSK